MKVVNLTGLRPYVMQACYESCPPDKTPEQYFEDTGYENPLADDVNSPVTVIQENVLPEMETLWEFIEVRLEE